MFLFFSFSFQEPGRRHICLVSSIAEFPFQMKYILNVLMTRGVLGTLYSLYCTLCVPISLLESWNCTQCASV